MARLIVHVGLPKTATTALQQYAFASLDQATFDFIGVKQPRGVKQQELYRELMSAIEVTDEIAPDEFERLTRVLEERARTKTVVISEEMLTVDTLVTWQTKLAQLSRLLNGLSTEILVTIREPASATFSLYVELYRKLNSEFHSFEGFCNSNQAQIYNYETLFTELAKYFPRKCIHAIPFEFLEQGRRFLSRIETVFETQFQFTTLPRTNDKARTVGGAYSKPLSVAGLLNHQIETRSDGPVRHLLCISRRLIRPLHPLTSRIICPWTREFVTEPDFRTIRNRFSAPNKWLSSEFGITY